ncbi:PIN domain-containing protein [Schizophyllum commune]
MQASQEFERQQYEALMNAHGAGSLSASPGVAPMGNTPFSGSHPFASPPPFSPNGSPFDQAQAQQAQYFHQSQSPSPHPFLAQQQLYPSQSPSPFPQQYPSMPFGQSPQNPFNSNGFAQSHNGFDNPRNGFSQPSNGLSPTEQYLPPDGFAQNAFATPSPLPPFAPTPNAFAAPSNAFHSNASTNAFGSSSNAFASPAIIPAREPSPEPEPDAPTLPDKAFKHHRQTITQIENDVEMQPPVSEQDDLYLILDTNILLHFFDVLVRFVEDVEKHGVPLVVVVPGIVVRELDSQKNRRDLSWGSRRASTWLLKKIHDQKSAVRGQALGDTMRSSKNWTVREDNERDNNNDYDILDCWRYFASTGKRSVLLSNDNNLRLAVSVECQNGNVRGEAMQPKAHGWSSREMAEMLYGKEYKYLFKDFGDDSKRYTKKKNVKVQLAQVDEDAMDMDEPMKEPDDWILPKHALDILHLNVVNHFEYLLQMLVQRAAGPNHSIGKDTGSRYQPEWEKKPISQWVAPDCIEFLQKQRRTEFPSGSTDERRLCRFLSREHTRGAGGRRGAMWSRADWDQNLALLERLAQTWEDEAIQESLVILYPEWVYIFSLRMTPTGS